MLSKFNYYQFGMIIKNINAFRDGKTLQTLKKPDVFEDITSSEVDKLLLPILNLWVKPRPKYIPYKKADPRWIGLKVKSMDANYSMITNIDMNEDEQFCISIGESLLSLRLFFKKYKWYTIDKNGNEELTPCGELTNE